MAKGGRREGAGRKPGSPNKATQARQAEIEGTGITPLDLLITTLRDEQLDLAVRLDAAKSAAPYVHPRLSTVEAKHSGEVTVNSWKVEYAKP